MLNHRFNNNLIEEFQLEDKLFKNEEKENVVDSKKEMLNHNLNQKFKRTASNFLNPYNTL